VIYQTPSTLLRNNLSRRLVVRPRAGARAWSSSGSLLFSGQELREEVGQRRYSLRAAVHNKSGVRDRKAH